MSAILEITRKCIAILNETISLCFSFLVARGGILEAEGTVEIKYRLRDITKTMHRLDPDCKIIKQRLAKADISQTDRASLEKELSDREETLIPMYRQVAVRFADLHDTANRMQEKGCIQVGGAVSDEVGM